MTRKSFRNTTWNLFLVLSLAVILLPFGANAQTAVNSTQLSSPAYDINKEIKVEGTIEKIQSSGSGSSLGTHVLIQGPEGIVDVNLGASSAVSVKNLGLSVGENVNITGMMATVGGNSVLLARILTTSSHIYMLRNERGAPVRSLLPRGSSSAASTQKGAL